MTKTDRGPTPVWERLSKNARMGSDRKRGLYVAARRLAAPVRSTKRTLAARRGSDGSGLTIPSDRGFLVYGPDDISEAREIVEVAQRRLEKTDPGEIRKRGKSFMVPILDQASLTHESPLVRLALREDVLRAVSAYLGVTPILASIDVYYSRSVDRELISSQLLHCDGDDTRQIKIFVLCTPVDEASGPLTIMDADRSETLRRKLGYEYRSRVSDEQARAAMGALEVTALAGEPGTPCFVDTSRCFHYGSRIESSDDARLVAIIQYLTPYSFMLPRDYRRAARYRHLATNGSSRLERLVLGAS
jgi:hypothetical protein